MDALSMALHIVYYSSSFQNAVFTLKLLFFFFSFIYIFFYRAANMGGDADTVGAIVGMIAGAYYGLTDDLLKLYQYVNKWDDFSFPLKAYKLFKGIRV